MPSPVQSTKVSILLLILLQPTKAARITKHDVHSSSTSQLNQSTAYKVPLWDKIDQFVQKGPIQLYDDSQVQGTLGSNFFWSEVFSRAMMGHMKVLLLDRQDPSKVVFDIGAAENPYVVFSKAFSYLDSHVLLLQSEAGDGGFHHLRFEDELQHNFTTYSHDWKFLEKFLAPSGSMFGDVKLSLSSRLSGRKKKGLWHGTLQKPLTTEHSGSNDKWAAWNLACPKGTTSNQKMVIPLEYNSFNAVKGLDKTNGEAGKYFEVFDENDANSPGAFVELKRLLSYRKGLLYLKYSCTHLTALRDPYIWIQKVSLMIKHESKKTYSLAGVEMNYPSYPTGPTFLSRANV